jgi:REP element-mobilizing transposase RayT
MTSPPPLLYDTYYHIYNRGNNGENIFIRERNYTHFMNLYAKYIEPVAETFAYCLLRNHFHLLVRVKAKEEIFPDEETLKVFASNGNQVRQGNLAKQGASRGKKPLGSVSEQYPSKNFSDFFNAYAKAINEAYNRTGSLFQHPFGRVPITSDRQFWNVIAYIHQNPQKHKFVDDFRDWKWSSYGIITAEKPTRLKREFVIDWFGGKDQYLELHKHWVTEAESKWFAEDDYD